MPDAPAGHPNPYGLPTVGPLLFELDRQLAQDVAVPGVVRVAVRAVVREGDSLLLVHSRTGGDYKFAGGGIEPGEDLGSALAREVAEECALIAEAGQPIGTVIEYHRDRAGSGLFVMASHYLHAVVTGTVPAGQLLDDYEAERGFMPQWVPPRQAAAANRSVMARGRHDRWVPRETRMLELLAEGWSDRSAGPLCAH